jgi:hypothetical protein
MNKIHQLFPARDLNAEDSNHDCNVHSCTSEREAANTHELCEFIAEMAFDLAVMSRRAGMDGAAQMLSLAALEVGLCQRQ